MLLLPEEPLEEASKVGGLEEVGESASPEGAEALLARDLGEAVPEARVKERGERVCVLSAKEREDPLEWRTESDIDRVDRNCPHVKRASFVLHYYKYSIKK